MKKRFLSLFLAIVTALSLVGAVSAEKMADYTLEGYNNKQLNNSWANVTLSDVTDENGVITTTASYEGELAAGKRIASFQPWEDGQSLGSAYTMHFGFTVNEITSPVYLEYNYSRDGGAKKSLVALSDSKVVAGGSIDGDTFVEVQAPYTVNFFMNTTNCEGSIYVNDKLLYKGGMRNSSADKKWREVRVMSIGTSNNIKFVTTAASSSIFDSYVSIDQVIDYIMNGKDFEEPEEPEIVYEEGIKDLSDYTLNGYNNKQLNNNWANVTLSDVTDENGVITTTASHTGDLDSGKRIASFQPWAEYQGIGSNASDHNIFQFGFTVNEITSPVYLEYNYSRDGGGKKSLISFSDSKVVVGGSMNGDTFIEVKAPYTINIFMNIKTYRGMIYVNDQLLYQGNLNNSSADKKWREVRVISLEKSKDIKLVTTKANSSIFNSDVAFTNVVDYVLNREDAVNTNWIWKIDGFNLNMGNMQGAVDGVTNVTGNNEDGYVLQPNSINASHYGFARYFLAQESGTALAKSDNDKVLWQSFEYNPTVLTSGQIFEIRGNNAYQTLMRAVPATETEPAYLETTSGGKVCNLDESKFYKIDLIVNNKDYEYYIVVDGKVAAHDIIWDSRQPLWNTVFSSYTTDEKMTIKNLETTVYDDTVTMADVLKKVSTSVYTDISDVVYDDSAKELTVTATFTGDETLFETAELVYAAFDADGTLVAVDVVTAYSEDVNATEFGRAYPYGFLDISNVAEGEKLNIKAFLWENFAGVTPISNVGAYSYTVPTTAVVE